MNREGSILMISLWILAILVIFALGLGHRASIGLRLARYQRDRLRAYCIGKAGIKRTFILLEQDANDPKTKDVDTIDECGINLNGKKPEEIFSKRWQDGQEFKIGYRDSSGEFIYGLTDEERRININLADTDLLQQLFTFAGAGTDAQDLAMITVEWINTAKEEGKDKNIFKNGELGRAEELLPILQYFYQNEERARQIYNKLSGLITVFGENKQNINTAPEEILTILAGKAASAANVNAEFAASVVSKIIAFRGSDKGPFVNDEAIDSFPAELAAAEEKNIFTQMRDDLVTSSDYFRICIAGSSGRANKNIALVYDRKGKKILSWHEN